MVHVQFISYRSPFRIQIGKMYILLCESTISAGNVFIFTRPWQEIRARIETGSDWSMKSKTLLSLLDRNLYKRKKYDHIKPLKWQCLNEEISSRGVKKKEEKKKSCTIAASVTAKDKIIETTS